MNIGVVIVTYANRHDYCKKVILKAISFSEVKKIVVVDNGVSELSSNVLRELEITSQKLIIHRMGHNSGSAKGFKEGLTRIKKEAIDLVWILDDDNEPRGDALKYLLNAWRTINSKNNPMIALLSYRPDRLIYKRAIQERNPYLMLGLKNSFLGFHFMSKFKASSPNESINTSIDIGNVAVAPYGGLFFSISLLDNIGLPNEEFFLYGDDYDFSYRITKNDGKIYLVTKSIVEDLEKSFHLKKKGLLNTRFFNTDSKNRIFYSVRNGIVFEQNFVENKFLYSINAVIYTVLILLLLLTRPKQLWKFKFILKGIFSSFKFKNDKT